MDLGKRVQFPQVVHTTLRPDMVLWSERSKKIIVVVIEQSCGKRSVTRPMNGRVPDVRPFCRIAQRRDGRHGFSQSKLPVMDSLSSQYGGFLVQLE